MFRFCNIGGDVAFVDDGSGNGCQSKKETEVPILSEMNMDNMYISTMQDGELILGVRAREDGSSFLCRVGSLSSKRWVGCAKNKLWWMTPCWGDDVRQLPIETLFLLVELKTEGYYAIFLPLISQGMFTAMLRGDTVLGNSRCVLLLIDCVLYFRLI